MVSSRTGEAVRPRRRFGWAALAASVMVGSVGCQAEYAGMTLPSGKYMYDDVQYFAPGPDFPLANTLAAQQRARMISQGIDPLGGNPAAAGVGAVAAPPAPGIGPGAAQGAFPLGGREGGGAPEAGLGGGGDSEPMDDNVLNRGNAPDVGVPTTPPNVPPPGSF